MLGTLTLPVKDIARNGMLKDTWTLAVGSASWLVTEVDGAFI